MRCWYIMFPMLHDEYGTKLTHLIKPVRVDYVIPRSNAIEHIEEGIFRTFIVGYIKDNFVYHSPIRMQVNLKQATMFAKNNHLRLLDEKYVVDGYYLQ